MEYILDEIEPNDIFVTYPCLLRPEGIYKNTLKNIFGFVPKINIKYAEIIHDNEYYELYNLDKTIGTTEDDVIIDILDSKILSLDVELEKCTTIKSEIICDLVKTDNMIYTIYEILNDKDYDEIINGLPYFDHNSIIIKHDNKKYKGYKSIDNIINNVKYYNIEYIKNKNGYVNIKDKYIPFSSFYNEYSNELIRNIYYDIPLLSKTFSVLIT